MEDNIKDTWREFIVYYVIFSMLYICFRFPMVSIGRVRGGSMENTLQNGDIIIGSKHIKEFERGKIYTVYSKDTNELVVKRCIGIEGDNVKAFFDEIYLNDELLNEPYINEKVNTHIGGGIFDVPEDHAVLFGDNRDISFDSRSWKNRYVSIEDVKSRAEFIIYPFNRIRIIK